MRFSLRVTCVLWCDHALVRGGVKGAEGSRGARISGMYSYGEPEQKEPPMEQRTGFRAFVERHDALFTTAGALIVFSWLFMKEGVRRRRRICRTR